MTWHGKRLAFYLICAGLIAGTLAIYWQSLGFEFIQYYDDADYITSNPHVRYGISMEGVRWALTHAHSANWHPLTWLSHMLDCTMFGLEPAGHHAVNVLFHIASTLLLFVALNRTTGLMWRSAFVAALFALHPLHVESVAWVAERKDVLSTFLWMLVMLAYVRYTRAESNRRLPWYALVLALFALGLMSKPTVVTLPIVLLLLDYWPLARLAKLRSPFSALWEKTPLLVLAAAGGIATLIAQSGAGATEAMDIYPITVRLANASVTCVTYLIKMVYPRDLAFFYPHPGTTIPVWQVVGSVLALATVTAAVIRMARSAPHLLVGWLWYLVTLLPMAGIVQAGDQAMADRYTYIALIGVFIMVAWGVPELQMFGKPASANTRTLAAASVVLAIIPIAHNQAGYWRDSNTLFRHAIRVTEDNYMAHNNLGLALADSGKLDEAEEHFRAAIEARPLYSSAYNNLGDTLARRGDIPGALRQFQAAVKTNPKNGKAHTNWGNALAMQGDWRRAISHYRRAIDLDPHDAKAHYNLGSILASLGKTEEAIGQLQAAVRIDPYDVKARNNLGYFLASTGRTREAEEQYRQALEISPDDSSANYNLADLLAADGRLDEAIKHYEKAIRGRPEWPAAHYSLGLALQRLGKIEQAVESYEEALRLDKNRLDAANNLAWIYSTHWDGAVRNPKEAVRLAERVNSATGGQAPGALDTLAAAYASAGRYTQAAATAGKAVSLARSAKDPALADSIGRRLRFYERGHPFRFAPGRFDKE